MVNLQKTTETQVISEQVSSFLEAYASCPADAEFDTWLAEQIRSRAPGISAADAAKIVGGIHEEMRACKAARDSLDQALQNGESASDWLDSQFGKRADGSTADLQRELGSALREQAGVLIADPGSRQPSGNAAAVAQNSPAHAVTATLADSARAAAFAAAAAALGDDNGTQLSAGQEASGKKMREALRKDPQQIKTVMAAAVETAQADMEPQHRTALEIIVDVVEAAVDFAKVLEKVIRDKAPLTEAVTVLGRGIIAAVGRIGGSAVLSTVLEILAAVQPYAPLLMIVLEPLVNYLGQPETRAAIARGIRSAARTAWEAVSGWAGSIAALHRSRQENTAWQ